MERLTGVDAGFLYLETAAAHMHTLKVFVLRPTPTAVPYDFERTKAQLAERLHLLPPLRWRILPVPWALHHPVRIEDPRLDLEQHLHRVQVPSPGGAREMDAAISEIAGTPLDRSRPLWELWILEGLAEGAVGAVMKIHHTLADGVAAAHLLANATTTEPTKMVPCEADARWSPDPIPSQGDLVVGAVRAHGRQLVRLPALLGSTATRVLALRRHERGKVVRAPVPLLDAPPTAINGALTARRAFATTSMPVADVKAVKRALGVTVNDVVLALVAGALRRYLADHGGLPARPLVAEVPVATDAADTVRLAGNALSNIFTSLCTDVADPVERLRAIHDVMAAAKARHEAFGAEMFREWGEYAPPALFALVAGLYSRLGLASRHRPAINVIVSNVAGPPQPLYWSDWRVSELFSVGPLIEGVGLNMTAWSYVDRLHATALACPDLLPDPHAITRGMVDALAELVGATGVESAQA